MQIITGITSAPKQAISIPLPDGSSVSLNLTFVPQQKGWFYDVGYSTRSPRAINFLVQGRRLVTSPNFLRQFQDIIPFGMAVVTNGNVEPTTQTAFTDGNLTFLLLDATDIALIEGQIYPGPSVVQTYGFTVGPIPIPDVVVSTFDKSVTSGMAFLYGFSGYRPTGNTQDDHDPTAPWNSGPILKWRKRTISGSMERKDTICNITCSFGVGTGFRSIENLNGDNTIDDSGTLTTGATCVRRDRLNPSYCDIPDTEVSNYPILGINESGWVFQAVGNGDSVPENTLTSKDITGLECTPNFTSARYYGTASEVISIPDTVEAAIDRVAFVPGTGACTYTALAGTNTPEGVGDLPLGDCASLVISLDVSGGVPFSSPTVRLNFSNTVISTGDPLADTFIDVPVSLGNTGSATLNFSVPQPLPDRRSCYIGFVLV